MASPELVCLFDIPWEQVLCKHLLPCLTLKELFQLRGLSRQFRDLVDCHFSLAFSVNTSLFSATFSSQAFEVLTRNNCCMKELIICSSKDWLTDAVLVPLLQANPGLSKIDISNCTTLSNSTLYTIGAHCRRVTTLNLRGCVWVSRDGLLSVISNRLPLQYVDLSGCWDISDDDIINLVTHCKGIQYLLLNNIYGLTNRCLILTARCCPDLLQLSIQGCWRLTDPAIVSVAEYCLKLRALQVRDCRQITEASLGILRARKIRIDKPAPAMNRLHLVGVGTEQNRHLNLQI